MKLRIRATLTEDGAEESLTMSPYIFVEKILSELLEVKLEDLSCLVAS